MKTTIDISDSILLEAKQLAHEQNVTLRSLVEEGLRKVIEERSACKTCQVHPVIFSGEGHSPQGQRYLSQRIEGKSKEDVEQKFWAVMDKVQDRPEFE